MPDTFTELDVRPILARGDEPFAAIMAAVESLPPGSGLRLIAPFRPNPLLGMMAGKGFSHEARPLDGTDWEVLFRPADADAPADAGQASAAPGDPTARLQPGAPAGAEETSARPGAPAEWPQPGAPAEWPQPSTTADVRFLEPPEPMVRILALIEDMADGAVLEALLPREPILLFPELEDRGHAWQGAVDEPGTYRIRIRKAGAP